MHTQPSGRPSSPPSNTPSRPPSSPRFSHLKGVTYSESTPTPPPDERKRKARTKKQNRKHQAPDKAQSMEGIFAYLPLEQTAEEGWVLNRYDLFTFRPGGRCYGLAADLRVATVRAFDALRIRRKGSEHGWLNPLIDSDRFSDQEVAAAHPAGHEFEDTDTSVFDSVKHRKRLSEGELKGLVAKYIRLNYSPRKCYIMEGGVEILGPAMAFNPRCVRKYVDRAFEARAYKKKLPAGEMDIVPVPGWNEECHKKMVEESKNLKNERITSGEASPSLYRMAQGRFVKPVKVKPAKAKTCAKGGRRG